MSVDTALEYALKCYSFQNCYIENINSGSNKVYRIYKDGQNFYVRTSTREYTYIAAEIDWMMFLKDSVKAPILVKSNNGNLIETFHDNEKSYVICVFYELKGVFWDSATRSYTNTTLQE